MKSSKQRLVIEAFPLLGDAPSGVGKLLFSMIDSLSRDDSFLSRYEIVLLVSLGKRKKLDKWNFDEQKVTVKELPLPLKGINLLDRLGIMLPVDILCGKGIYLFPNYRRLPLLFSKSLTYIHDASYLLFPDTVQEKNLAFLRRIVPRSMRRSDRVLTLSQQSARELKEAFPEQAEKVIVVPAGVDAKRYGVKKTASRKILNDLNVARGKYILFVGNIEPRKNINYLIDVYVELRKKPAYADLALVLAGGDGWRNAAILRRIDQLNAQGYDIIRPTRRVSDEELPVLYNESFVTALMAVHEGFGMTPLEALAAEGHVVVSDIPVLREVGRDVVAYATLTNASKAAESFVKASKTAPNQAAIDALLTTYSWDSAANELVRVIDSIKEEVVQRGQHA